MPVVSRFAPALGVALWLCLSPFVYAAHPLITEDTGTQGSGNFQLELTGEVIHTREAGQRQYASLASAVLAYGFAETADAIVSAHWLKLGQPDSSHGLAALGLDLKWRFYETGPVSFAFKPGVLYPVGDETKNLSTGRTIWSAYLVTTVDLKPWAFHLHLGHLHNNNTYNDRVNIWHASGAVSYQLLDSLKLVFDTGINTNTDSASDAHLVFSTIGLIWSVQPNLDLDLGFRADRTDTLSAQVALAGVTYRW